MPSLIFSDGTTSGFNWQVTGLSSAWNSSNYIQIVLSSGTTSEGSTSAPSGVVGSVSAPGSGSSTSTPKTYIGGSAGTTYNRNAYAQAANGRYYFVGSATITLPNSIPSGPNIPSNISFTVNGKNITAHYTKGGYYVHLDYSWINGYPDATTTALSYSFTVPEYNTYYSVDFQAENMDGQTSGWSGFKGFYSGPAPNPPSKLTNLTATAKSKSSVELNWSASSGADGYEIQSNGIWIDYVSGTSYTRDSLSEYTNYNFTVIPYNSYGDGTSATVSVRTLDQTVPTISITAETIRNTRISISWESFDAHSGVNQHQVFISKKNDTTLFYKATLDNESTYDFEFDADGLPLTGGAEYTVGVRAYDVQGNFSTRPQITRKTIISRPDSWVWFSSKVSGGSFSITAEEWNKMCSRINDFRNYKGLLPYGFTDAAVNATFFAYMFNQARTATSELPRSLSVPPLAVSGGDAYASYFNQLRDSLNSTTQN